MNKTQLIEAIIANDADMNEDELKGLTKAELENVLASYDEDNEELTTGQRMSATLRKYRVNYVKVKSATGRTSLNNGDDLASLLAGMEPKQVVAVAERALNLEPGELWAKYEHLNPGQQRMNAGNRIRAAIKREELTVDDVKAAA